MTSRVQRSDEDDAAREKKNTQITKGLAEKLQAGWTMLATTCPACNTPLVREKAAPGAAPAALNKMYCVGCSMWVVREQDLTPEQKNAALSPAPTPSPKGSAASTAAASKPSTGSASKPPAHPAASSFSPASSSSSSSSASASAAARPSLAALESGLASLSDHASFDKYARELRMESDGPEADAEAEADAAAAADAAHDSSLDGLDEEERAIASYASRPNKTAQAARSNLDAYARSKAASASRARAEEEDEFEFVPVSSEARLQEHTSKVNSLSAKLGAKMMAGWTLMGDTCPNAACTCPLVRARGETVNMLCVNCGAHVTKHGETLSITKPGTSVPMGNNNPAAPAPKAAQHTIAPHAAASAAPSSSSSAFRASGSRPGARRRGPRQTRRQREVEEDSDDDEDEEDESEDEEEALMRQLQEEADKVGPSFPPLQRKTSSNSTPPQQQRKQLQQQQQSSHFSSDLDDPYSLAGLPTDLSDAATSRRTAAPVSASVQKSENVSAKLGEKMMQGYALLGQCCPRDSCDCPLVRKRDGPLLCVSCGSTIIQAREHDLATQGPAGNEPGEDGWIAVNPAAAAKAAAAAASSAASTTAASGAHRTVTPIKRLPSPSVTESFDAEHHEKKARGSAAAASTNGGTFAVGSRNADSPSFQSLSPLVRSPRGSNNAQQQLQLQQYQSQQAAQQQGSADSSGFPSPALNGQPRSRAQSMDTEYAGLESIDPRLRMLSSARSQLGGQRGRFNAPHSRAPSLAAPNTFPHGSGPVGAGHTSSAVFNAAAHMAFDRHGAPRDSPGIQRSGSRSGGSSLEQSPRIPLATPPATPLPNMALVSAFVPSALQINQAGTSSMLLPAGMHSVRDQGQRGSGGRAYPQSRHPSINVGGGSSLLQHQHQSSPQIRFEADPQSLAPLPVFSMAPATASPAAHLAQAPSASSTPDLHGAGVGASSSDVSDLDSVLSAAHQTLCAKLDEVRLALAASTDMVQCRELMATMRELFDTIQHIRQQ